MTEQMPDLGIGRVTSGVKASFERIKAWAKKNPALVVAIIAGVVILALLLKRKQPTGRVGIDKPREGNGDPLGGIGSGVPGTEAVPEAEDIELPIPAAPPPPPSSSSGVDTSTPYVPYVVPQTLLSELVSNVVKVRQGAGEFKRPERAGPSKIDLQRRIGRGPMAGWTGLELMRVARGDPRHNVPVGGTVPRYPSQSSRPAYSRRGPSSRSRPSSRRESSPSRRGPPPRRGPPSQRRRPGAGYREAARRGRDRDRRGGRR
ncbi:hypothetical protein LCGC14_0711030 [marine sediment metagenome]|uniref:Uncharacterized protein n=1 Tax=marine sediment metagenome TaxID=412755 RepID=A0A0F9T0J8_9ZZZZ